MFALTPTTSITIAHSPAFDDSRWLRYFSAAQAWEAVINHVESRPSSRTPERHTARAYLPALKYFLSWAGPQLPTADLINRYIAHLKAERGLKSSTIGSKYLSVLRLYLHRLAGQSIPGFTGAERDFISDCRDHLRAAHDAAVAPPKDEISYEAPLYQYGQRLTRTQVEDVYRAVERHTIKGRRDLALLYLGFTSGLRLAELHRLTLANIEPHEDHYLVRVRGKRNNITPVPIDHDAMQLILRYVEVYNDPLDADDPRRITRTSPLWQPLLHGDHHAHVGTNGYDPLRGLSQQGIRDVVQSRVRAAVNLTISPHDMRRTAAAMARKEGMEMESIQKLLRHSSIATTAKYVGDISSYDSRLISRRKRFEGIRDEVCA
jgi:site-specific recombinase XerD